MNQEEGDNVNDVREDVMNVVRNAFRPEFLNRIDEILLFSRLERKDIEGIVVIQLGYLHDLLKAQHITLELSDKARIWIADKGYDPVYGARPLKRVIQTQLQNKLAELLLSGEVSEGAKVTVDVKDKALDFTVSGGRQESEKSVA